MLEGLILKTDKTWFVYCGGAYIYIYIYVCLIYLYVNLYVCVLAAS